MLNSKAEEKLEREIKEYFGAGHVFLVSSGKAALFLILSALNRLTRKKKVVIPAYTCFSVPSAILLAGLEIVPCDIRPETLDFDFSQLTHLLDDDTLCVIPTHLFGIPADVSKVRDACEKRNIFIVEDAAQAMGVVGNRGKLGTSGDIGFFSLGRGKNITCGSGGIIITSEGAIAESLQKDHSEIYDVPTMEYVKNIVETVLLTVFLRPDFYWFPKSLPFLKIGETRFFPSFPVRKFTGFQAGLLHDWRQKLERFQRGRSGTADFYIDNLDLSNALPIYANGLPYNRFPVYLEGKVKKNYFCENGESLGISPMYPLPVHEIEQIRKKFENRTFQGAEDVSNTLVTLPTHVYLKDKDRVRILELINGTDGIRQGSVDSTKRRASYR